MSEEDPKRGDETGEGEETPGKKSLSEERPAKKRRWPLRLLQVLLGLLLGCALAELAFNLHDEGSFPHLNLYVPDDELGVRLRANSEQGFKFRDNPTTTITAGTRSSTTANKITKKKQAV